MRARVRCVRTYVCDDVCFSRLSSFHSLYTRPSPHGDVTLKRPPTFPASPIDNRSAMIDENEKSLNYEK